MAAQTALQKITIRVKKLRKEHPKKDYKTLQRLASSQLKKEGKIGSVKKKAAGPKKAIGKKPESKLKIQFNKKTLVPKISIVKAPKKKRIGSASDDIIEEVLILKESGYDDNEIRSVIAEEFMMEGEGCGSVRKSKKGTSFIKLSGVSMNRLNSEIQHQKGLEATLHKHRSMLSQKGLKPAEKAAIRRDIEKYKKAITASKKHAQALKRSI